MTLAAGTRLGAYEIVALAGSGECNVALNWLEELKQKVPVGTK